MHKDIPFTDQEANVLIQLLDTATKAGGLQVAENSLHFVKKMQAAFKQVEEVTPEVVEPVTDKNAKK